MKTRTKRGFFAKAGALLAIAALAISASPVQAKTLLGWQAEKGIREMCEDHWRWQEGNPEGFGD